MKIKKAQRFCFYLNISNPFETDNKDEKRRDVGRRFIALHHFHPKVIDPKNRIAEVVCEGRRYRLPDTVSERQLKNLGLAQMFSPQDHHEDDRIIIVPNYPLSKAEADFSVVSSRPKPSLTYQRFDVLCSITSIVAL